MLVTLAAVYAIVIFMFVRRVIVERRKARLLNPKVPPDKLTA